MRVLMFQYRRKFLALMLSIFLLLPADLVFSQNQNTEAEKKKNNADELAPPKSSTREAKPEEYKQESFPDWMYYTYRFTAVAVGSIPFSLLFATIAYDSYKTTDESLNAGSFQSQYLPLFLSGPEKPAYDSEEVEKLLVATLAISVSISITDLVILLIRQQRGNTVRQVFE